MDSALAFARNWVSTCKEQQSRRAGKRVEAFHSNSRQRASQLITVHSQGKRPYIRKPVNMHAIIRTVAS